MGAAKVIPIRTKLKNRPVKLPGFVPEAPVDVPVVRAPRELTSAEIEDRVRTKVAEKYPIGQHAELQRWPENGSFSIFTLSAGFTKLQPLSPEKIEQGYILASEIQKFYSHGAVPGFGCWVDLAGQFCAADSGFFIRLRAIDVSSWKSHWGRSAYGSNKVEIDFGAALSDVILRSTCQLEEFERFVSQVRRDISRDAAVAPDRSPPMKIRVFIDPVKAIKAKRSRYGFVDIELEDKDIQSCSDEELALIADMASLGDACPPLGKGFWISDDGEKICLSLAHFPSGEYVQCDDIEITDASVKGVRECLQGRLAVLSDRRQEIEAEIAANAARDAAEMKKLKTEVLKSYLEAGAESLLQKDSIGVWRVTIPVEDVRLVPLIREAQVRASERNKALMEKK